MAPWPALHICPSCTLELAGGCVTNALPSADCMIRCLWHVVTMHEASGKGVGVLHAQPGQLDAQLILLHRCLECCLYVSPVYLAASAVLLG